MKVSDRRIKEQSSRDLEIEKYIREFRRNHHVEVANRQRFQSTETERLYTQLPKERALSLE